MMKRAPYLLYAAGAVLILAFASAVGYLQNHVPAKQQARSALGSPLNEQQTLSRRRAAMATAALADTTTQ